MRADHHHLPAANDLFLQQKTAGFAIETQEEDRIRLHLSFQEQRGQGAALLGRQKRPIWTVLQRFPYRGNEPVANRISRQIREELQDPIGLALKTSRRACRWRPQEAQGNRPPDDGMADKAPRTPGQNIKKGGLSPSPRLLWQAGANR